MVYTTRKYRSLVWSHLIPMRDERREKEIWCSIDLVYRCVVFFWREEGMTFMINKMINWFLLSLKIFTVCISNSLIIQISAMGNGFLIFWDLDKFKSNHPLLHFLGKVHCPTQEFCNSPEVDIYKVANLWFQVLHQLFSYFSPELVLSLFLYCLKGRTNKSLQIYFEI